MIRRLGREGTRGNGNFIWNIAFHFLFPLSPQFSPSAHLSMGGTGTKEPPISQTFSPTNVKKSVVSVTLSISRHTGVLLSSTTRASSYLFLTTFQLFIDVEIHS